MYLRILFVNIIYVVVFYVNIFLYFCCYTFYYINFYNEILKKNLFCNLNVK